MVDNVARGGGGDDGVVVGDVVKGGVHSKYGIIYRNSGHCMPSSLGRKVNSTDLCGTELRINISFSPLSHSNYVCA